MFRHSRGKLVELDILLHHPLVESDPRQWYAHRSQQVSQIRKSIYVQSKMTQVNAWATRR